MSNGVNKVIIMGRLGQDPEAKNTGNSSVTRISVATDESWNDKDGTKQTRTEWHRIVCWGKRGEAMAKYFHKGDGIYVEGRLQTRKYEDKEGITRWSTEIVATDWQFLPGSSKNSERGDQSDRDDRSNQRDEPDHRSTHPDDDIPFALATDMRDELILADACWRRALWP